MQHDKFSGWRKSSRSSGTGNCVEAGATPDRTVGVRDTNQQGHGPVLNLSARTWKNFLASTKDGEYDQ